jgi:hypothetical protein
MYHCVFREEIRLALSGVGSQDAWGAKVLRVLRALGYDLDSLTGATEMESRVAALASHKLDVAALLAEMKDRFTLVMCPSACEP